MIQYRKEIDGLRAIAVIPVLLFHAGIGFVPGGFYGVDIFFVISGYLITSILLKDLENGHYSILDFYERRARRILPALTAVLVFTSVVAFLVMSPEDLKSYSQSVVSVALFSSNIYFYLTSGYFATASEELPLLHTWSLAVEEQFYLFFPVLLYLLWKWGRSSKKVIWGLSVLSFIGCLWFAEKDSSANFYLIHTRAWELFSGALVAMSYTSLARYSSTLREIFSWFGVGLLFFSILVLDKTYSHPGWATLAPVLGTCLIIAFSNQTHSAKFLGNRGFVWIGLISYSLYLWHQPIYAFIRLKFESEPPLDIFLIATLVSIALAWASYRYVERPFRNRKFMTRQKIFGVSGFALSLFMLLGVAGHLGEGWSKRFSLGMDLASIDYSPARYSCTSSSGNYIAPESACRLNKMSSAQWAVLGDSHGIEISYSLAKKLSFSNQDVVQLTYSGCPPAYQFETIVKGCSGWLKETMEYIKNEDKIQNVILAYRHTAYLYGYKEGKATKEMPRKVKGEEGASVAELHELYWSSFESMVKELKGSGKNVILLYPIPELVADVTKLVIPQTIFDTEIDENKIRVDISRYKEKNFYSVERLNRLNSKYQLEEIFPSNTLCDSSNCYAVKDSKALYFDDNHLSVAGADLVLTELLVQ
ncbi:acyltransferase family protein [Hahella ganghwensis]|uniref:acyltransferase family protein n=1 Tax=Hahella ganghwensis TaxID=286420 RepID=UPI00037A83CF|nr:acyltransferase family protein [Hahella ganghwensis]